MREVACQLAAAAALRSSDDILHADCVVQGMIRHYRVSALFRQYQAPRTVTPTHPHSLPHLLLHILVPMAWDIASVKYLFAPVPSL
jgi:hypothetical protein